MYPWVIIPTISIKQIPKQIVSIHVLDLNKIFNKILDFAYNIIKKVFILFSLILTTVFSDVK